MYIKEGGAHHTLAYERRPISGCRVRAEPVTAGNTSAFAGYMQAQLLNQAIVK